MGAEGCGLLGSRRSSSVPPQDSQGQPLLMPLLFLGVGLQSVLPRLDSFGHWNLLSLFPWSPVFLTLGPLCSGIELVCSPVHWEPVEG